MNGSRHRAARVKLTIKKRVDAAPVHGMVIRPFELRRRQEIRVMPHTSDKSTRVIQAIHHNDSRTVRSMPQVASDPRSRRLEGDGFRRPYSRPRKHRTARREPALRHIVRFGLVEPGER